MLNPAHIGRSIVCLLRQPGRAEAVQWFRQFSELSDAIAEAHAHCELACLQDTTNRLAHEQLTLFNQNILNLALTHKAQLIDVYLNSQWKHLMHPDDCGRLAQILALKAKYSKDRRVVKLQNTESVLVREYRSITGRIIAKFNNRSVPLAVVSGKMNDFNAKVRKDAFFAYWQAIHKNETQLQELFDKLTINRLQQVEFSGANGYQDFVFAEMGRLDFDPNDCRRFCQSIQDVVVPRISTLLRERQHPTSPWNAGSLNGLETTIQPCGGNPLAISQSVEHIVSGLSTHFSQILVSLQKSGRLDIFSRPGKAAGAFCMPMPVSQIPCVFMNLGSSAKDVFTYLHELGHGMHAVFMHQTTNSLLRTPGMEFCEVASLGLENLALAQLELLWPSQSHLAKAAHHFGSLNFWPFMAAIHMWQDAIYHPDFQHTAHARNAVWKNLSRTYRPHLNWSGCEEFEALGWMSRPHIFTTPFYYIDYGIAQLGALQIAKNFKTNKTDTLLKFVASMRLGGQKSLQALFETAGVCLDFGPSLLTELADELLVSIRSV